MTSVAARPERRQVPEPDPAARSQLLGSHRTAGLVAALVLLVAVTVLSIGVGSRSFPPATVLRALLGTDGGSSAGDIVRSLRVPRTLLGLAVGAALGLAGALLQAVTRNPLAEPGILGVNAGAAAAVVTGLGLLDLQSTGVYVWFALAGAGIVTAMVYVLGSRGHAAATPVRLALAGAALAAVLHAYVAGLTLAKPETFDGFRFWTVGALAGRPLGVLVAVLPFIVVGALLAFALGPALNALAMGEDTGRALGVHTTRTRAGAVIAATLLAGAATAAAGPVAFVGLVVPHAARILIGPDQRWILPYSAVLGPVLLLAADVVGRVVTPPGELEVGIVTAFVGAPVFIWLVRRSRAVTL